MWLRREEEGMGGAERGVARTIEENGSEVMG